MKKKKNRPQTWYEKKFDAFLNVLEDIIFLENIYLKIPISGCMPIIYVIVVFVFCSLTVVGLSGG